MLAVGNRLQYQVFCHSGTTDEFHQDIDVGILCDGENIPHQVQTGGIAIRVVAARTNLNNLNITACPCADNTAISSQDIHCATGYCSQPTDTDSNRFQYMLLKTITTADKIQSDIKSVAPY